MKHWSLGAECLIEDRRLTTIWSVQECSLMLGVAGKLQHALIWPSRQSAARIRLSQETISQKCAGEADRYIPNKETALNCQ